MAKYGPADVADQYQQVLGRAPTAADNDFFSKLLKEGGIQPYEVGQILQSGPEYQQKLLQQNGQKYSDLLGASDANVLGKAGAQINSQFAEMGRPVSSGQVGALAQAGQNLAQQRQSALAAFYGKGLNQNQSLYEMNGQNSMNRGYGLRDEKRQRQYQIEDYYRQQNDFNNYQNSHGGWNAITPELVTNGLFSIGGKAAAGYAGSL